MAGNFQNLEIGAEKITVRRFFDEEIRFHGFDLKLEAEAAKKIAIRNHGSGEWVTPDLAAKLALNPRNILNMIDVPVCQKQKFGMDIERAYPFAGTLRRVEENPSLRRFEQVAIGLKNPAAKCFGLRHVESLNRYTVTSEFTLQQSTGLTLQRFNDLTGRMGIL